MDWEIRDYSALSTDELYEILKLRFRVFVVEQKCMELDMDGKDQASKHMFIRKDGAVIACLRIIPPGVSYEEASIGRFAVQEEFRKNGIGKKGMETAMNYILTRWGESAIRISGQAYLRDFYCGLGFEVVKGPYLEDKIPHYQFLFSVKQ